MPEKNYSITPEGPIRIKLKWSGIWKNMEVFCDEQTLGVIENQKSLKQGADFALPDGEKLHVVLSGGFQPTLKVLINGTPAPGSDSDPKKVLESAVGVVYVVAALSVLNGAAAVAGVAFLANMGFGFSAIISGCIMGALGFWTKKSNSKIALILAIALFALDGIASVVGVIATGGDPPAGALVVRVFFILSMFKGVKAIDRLKQEK